MQPGDVHGRGPDHYRRHLDRLRREGRALAADSASCDEACVRAWQGRCAAIIGQLSGGMKSHWLARAFSDAFLVTSGGAAGVTTAVPAARIVSRVLTVLDRASAALAQLEQADGSDPSTDVAVASERFAFIGDAALRVGLAEVDREAREAFDRARYALALVGTCSVLESVITETIRRAAAPEPKAGDPSAGPVTRWPFETRIAAAETGGCISSACARLPASARRYRELLDADGDLREGAEVSRHDAGRARQVLRIILHDLAPGR